MLKLSGGVFWVFWCPVKFLIFSLIFNSFYKFTVRVIFLHKVAASSLRFLGFISVIFLQNPYWLEKYEFISDKANEKNVKECTVKKRTKLDFFKFLDFKDAILVVFQ